MSDLRFDIDAIRKNCEEFFELYNVTKNEVFEMCQLKLIHTRAVAENCLRISRNMGLSEYDCELAWIIGELHDFARFGQAVVTKSLDDSDRYNHAKLGARILFTHGLIEDIIPNYNEVCSEDKIVMEKAVYHHSDFHLPNDLKERELLFCKIIREADQLDIFRTIVQSGWETIYSCSKEELLEGEISDEIAEAFFAHTLADYSKRVSMADFHMAHIALCFGLGSESSRQRAVEQGFILKMMDIEFKKPDVQKKYAELKAEVYKFLDITMPCPEI